MIFFTDFSENEPGKYPLTNWRERMLTPGSKYGIVRDLENRNTLYIATAGTSGSNILSCNSLNNRSDIETLTLFRVVDTSREGRFGISYARYSGDSEKTTAGYNISFTPINGKPGLILSEDSKGTISDKPFDWQLNEWYYCRMSAKGDEIKAKVWRDNVSEPKDWTLSTNYKKEMGYSVYSGIGTYIKNSRIEYRMFSASTEDSPAPTSRPPYESSPSNPSGGYGGIAMGFGAATTGVIGSIEQKISINYTESKTKSDEIALVVNQVLTIRDVHAETASDMIRQLVQDQNVRIYLGRSYSRADTITLTGMGVVLDNSTYSVSSDNIAVKQTHTVSPYLSRCTTGSNTVSISSGVSLSIDSVNMFAFSSDIALAIDHYVTIDNSKHNINADEIRLTNWTDLGVDFGIYPSETNDKGEYTKVNKDETLMYIPVIKEKGKL